MGTDRITAAQIDASGSKSDGQISCTEFAQAVTAQKTPAYQVVAHHINNDLYCQIFGDQPPSEFLLESWIEDQTKLSTDFFIKGAANNANLHDGIIRHGDLDALFHALEDFTGRADSGDNMVDQMTPEQLSGLWDPSFGDARAAAQKTTRKRDDLVCPTPTHQNDHVVKPPVVKETSPYTITRDDIIDNAFRKAIEEEIESGKPKNGITILYYGEMHDFDGLGSGGRLTKAEVDAFFREFDTPPAPKPAPKPFTRELTHYTTQKPAGTTTERLRYTISGNAITVEVIGADGKATKTLNVPAAKLPEGQISSPEGTYITTDGRMVASIPVYAVLNFKDGKPSTDAALDMIEITWDAKGTGPADNPYGVAVETFVAPGTHSGAKLKNQSSLDLDGDGKPETLQTHKMQDHHLANRSTPDALGQSTNPTGWEADTQTTDADEPHARIQIHMSSIGTPVQK